MPRPSPIFLFDIDKLLSPITSDEPAGVNLRYDPIYDRIRELRREDDSTLPQGIWKSEQKRADWSSVESLCLEILETRSKDLQVAAWLTEAWLHLHGFSGAAEGFRAMQAVCESFWSDLHPRIEGGDEEFRIAPLVWLNRKLPADLKLLPLTAPEADGVACCNLADWETACQVQNMQSKPGPQPPTPDRDMTLARFHQSATLTPTANLTGKLAEVQTLIHRCAELGILLDAKLGKQSPGLLTIRGTAEAAASVLEAVLRERGALQPANEDTDGNETVGEGEGQLLEASPWRIRTRSEAYQALSEAAEFLGRTEPHSPTSYLVRRAISWGSMSLEQLLPELVRNTGELSEIYRLLDVRHTESGKK